MEKNILIIGNGFDLYHRLPTSYTNFMDFVKKWPEYYRKYYTSKKMKNMKRQLSKGPFEIPLDNNGNIINATMEGFASRGYIYDEKAIHYLYENVPINNWIKWFQKRNYRNARWVDFEYEIEEALWRVNEYFEKDVRKRSYRPMSEFVGKDTREILALFNEKGLFTNLDDIYFLESELDSEKINEEKNIFLNYMKMQMDILNQCLYYYFAEFVSRVKCPVYSRQIKELQNVYLLSFNYTFTYQNVYGESKLKKYHSVHGNIKDNNLVLGISDDGCDDLDYIYFQKYFQRIQKRTGSDYRKWFSEGEKREELIFAHIMGHSLDQTDKSVFKDIFMAEYIRKIYIYYHNQNAYESQVINLIGMFGKDFVIEQVANERIVFLQLEEPVSYENLESTISR